MGSVLFNKETVITPLVESSKQYSGSLPSPPLLVMFSFLRDRNLPYKASVMRWICLLDLVSPGS